MFDEGVAEVSICVVVEQVHYPTVRVSFSSVSSAKRWVEQECRVSEFPSLHDACCALEDRDGIRWVSWEYYAAFYLSRAGKPCPPPTAGLPLLRPVDEVN